MNAPSGRVVLSDEGITIDDAGVLAVEGIELGDENVFHLIYSTICSACVGHGHRHQRRCEWCDLDAAGNYVDKPEARLPVSDLPALRAWARRQQFMPTQDGHAELARALLDGIKKMDAEAAKGHRAINERDVLEQTREVA